MGIHGYWLRVSPSELARASSDPGWVRDQAYGLAGTGEMRAAGELRAFSTEKAWHALEYLLARRGFPVAIVFGEELLAGGGEDEQADWDYGAPQYLSAERVQCAAGALSGLSERALLDGVDPAELRRDGVYPGEWDSGELSWAASFLPDVTAYFNEAARDGDAVVCWIA